MWIVFSAGPLPTQSKATADLTRGTTAGIGGWLGLLAAFDAAYLAAGYLVFGHLLED